MVRHCDYGSMPSVPSVRPRAQRSAVAVAALLALGLACVTLTLLTAPKEVSLLSDSESSTENDALQALQSSDRLLATSSLEASVHRARLPRLSALHSTDSNDSIDNLVAAAVKKVENRALGKALKAQKRAVQGLAETEEGAEDAGAPAEEESGEEETEEKGPMFYEHYKKGMLGFGAVSKWVSADHPEGHKKCKLHDIDCDELWPWGKVHVKHETAPKERHGILGDDKLGVFGEDDRVVKTEDSGLLPRVDNDNKDHFDHWDPDSEKNKQLLYGSMRGEIFDHENGVGDEHVPTSTLERDAAEHKAKAFPLADLAFGSWEQGFHKPHDHDIRHHLSMFDQPYRQHMSAARGDGHIVYKEPSKSLGKSI